MAQTMEAHRPRSLDASSVDRLFVGVVIGRVDRLGQGECENRHENRSKIGPDGGSGHPKSSQNRSREPLGTPRGDQERPEGVSGASRERLGVSPARPGNARRVSKGAPGRQQGRPGASGSAPSRPKSTPRRVRERKNQVFFVRHVCGASSERFFDDFRFFRKVRNVCFVPRLPAETEVRPFALRVESLARCNLEKP